MVPLEGEITRANFISFGLTIINDSSFLQQLFDMISPFSQSMNAVLFNSILYLFKSSSLFDNLTVADHLHLIALLHNVSLNRAHHQAKILAEQIGLDRDAFNHKASLLSGGQKRRLTLGMAMMSQPRVLLLDEPTVRI